ncbi:MAG: tetratricopeptide repeat protein [Actinomycetota bacterium]
MNQESAVYFYECAEFYLEQGKVEDAVIACEQALQQKPDFAPAYKILGQVSQAQGNLEQAKHWYHKALEIQPNFPEVYTHLATLYAQQQNWQQALACYQKSTGTLIKDTVNSRSEIFTFNPHDIDIYIQGAEAFYQSRKFEQAIKVCQRVIKMKSDARAYKILGNAKQAQGQIEEAKQCYEKALEIEPDFAEAYINLGTLYAQQQEWEPAINCYQKALTLKPDLASAYRNLAKAWTQIGQLAAADECWYQAYSMEPEKATPEEHIQLGNTLLRQNQVAQAITCYCHAIELNPNFDEAYQNLGKALQVQRKLHEEAVRYRKFLERPSNMIGDLLKTIVLTLSARGDLLGDSRESSVYVTAKTNQLQIADPNLSEKIENFQRSKSEVKNTGLRLSTLDFSPKTAAVSEEGSDIFLPLVASVTVATNSLPKNIDKEELLTVDACIQQAKLYTNQQNFDRAIAECKRAIKIKPDALVAYKLLAKLLQVQGKQAEAASCYQKAIEIQPKDAELYLNFGSLYAQNKQWAQAVFCYQKAIAIKPNLAAAYRNLAKAWMQLSKPLEAAGCWFEAYSLEPEKVTPEKHLQLGNSLYKQGQLTQAMACYRRAIEFNPNFAGAYQNLGKALKQQGKWEEAEACFRRAMEINCQGNLSSEHSGENSRSVGLKNEQSNSLKSAPMSYVGEGTSLPSSLNARNQDRKPIAIVSARNNLVPATANLTANSYHQLQETISSVMLVKGENGGKKLAITVNSESAVTYLKQAESDYAQKKFEQAIAACKRAIEIKPDVPVAYKLLGNACQAVNREEEAWLWYTKALELQADFAEVHENIGSLYAQQQQWQKAIACYEKAIALKPDLVSARRNLARVFLELGKAEEGAEGWYQALTCDRSLATVEEYWTLGNMLLKQGKVEQAIDCYRSVIQLQPSLADAYHNLGEALTVKQQWEEAIITYRQAIKLNPNDEGSHYCLGKALAKLERWQEAIACYQRAIELKSDNWEVYQKLGDALQQEGQIDEAIAVYCRAVELTKF